MVVVITHFCPCMRAGAEKCVRCCGCTLTDRCNLTLQILDPQKMLDSDGILAIEIQHQSIAQFEQKESADGFCLVFSNSPVSIHVAQCDMKFFKKTLAHDSSNRISSRAKCASIFKFEDM